MHEGWNLISFSVKSCFYVDGVSGYEDGHPANPMLSGTIFRKVNSIADVFASIEGKYDVVRSFDSIGAHTFDPTLPEFSDIKYIAGGYGYWIKMNTAGNLQVNGIRALPSDTLELSTGWNLVGYWHPDVQYTDISPMVDFPTDVGVFEAVDSINAIIVSITNKYAAIRSYDINGAHTYDPQLEQFTDLDYIGPGYGLWVKMKTPGVLSY